ncbi:DNA-directed RNA polymerase core subunit rpc10 [Toensbergia leucococca]|nr:DNA-directed RNA polymerase core subunit rpc10 [Toensbergia leucococca]
MSREQHVTLSTQASARELNFPVSNPEVPRGPVTQYLCGGCDVKVKLQKGDKIRCHECGHRVVYKERTKR